MRAKSGLVVLLVALVAGAVVVGQRSLASHDAPTFVTADAPTAALPIVPTTPTTAAAAAAAGANTASSTKATQGGAAATTTTTKPATKLPKDQLIFDGQSFNYSPVGTQQTYPAQLVSLLGQVVGLNATTAIPATTYAQRATTVSTRVDSLYRLAQRTTVLDLGGQSDLLANMTAPQLLSVVQAYADARRAAGATYVVEFTLTPSTWYSALQNVQRVLYNTLLKTNLGHHFNAVVDIASRPEFADPDNTTYFVDGMHPTAAAAAIFATLTENVLNLLLR